MTTTASTETTTSSSIPEFYHDLHVNYIRTLASKIDSKSSYEGAVTEHLRMSGIYWSLTALSILVPFEEVDTLMNLTGNQLSKDDDEESENNNDDSNDIHNINRRPTIVDFVYSCYDSKSGGFGGNINQDGHVLYTLSAIQILALSNALSQDRFLKIKPNVIKFLSSLQQEDGSFAGDEWGEVDTRFTYCALSSLSLLGSLHDVHDTSVVDVDKAATYIASCQNFDGGFGCTPGAESHAGQIFTCIGALSIAKRLDLIQDVELLSWWLSERQCDSGGLNGRPEKQADVCYSWWILSSLCILGRVNYIKGGKLAAFILKCQDEEDGGIADRPGDMVDVFHTFFGIAGLSLIGCLHSNNQHGDGISLNDGSSYSLKVASDSDGKIQKMYRMIDPIYALPTDVVQGLNLQGQIMKSNEETEERLSLYDVL